jgi:hypothetical protein
MLMTPFAFQHIGESRAGELRSLVAVEHFRRAVMAQSVLQAIDTEHGLHAVADPPAEDFAAVPVDEGDPVGEAARQPDGRDVNAPHRTRSDHLNPSQQVGIDLVLGMRATGVGARRPSHPSDLTHQALYPFAVDRLALHFQKRPPLPTAVERVPCELFVDQWAEQQVAFIDRPGFLLRIDRRT